jgi:cation-transporting ATPase 13A2
MHLTHAGWLLFSMVILIVINLVVLLSPPKAVLHLLKLKTLPFSARKTLLLTVVINVAISLAFEQWGAQAISRAVGALLRLRRGRRRTRDGKTYKTVEGRMR